MGASLPGQLNFVQWSLIFWFHCTLLHVLLLVPAVSKWLLYFWKILSTCPKSHFTEVIRTLHGSSTFMYDQLPAKSDNGELQKLFRFRVLQSVLQNFANKAPGCQ
jgi:hypothetical protein